MSIDTTFQPRSATYAVDSSAVVTLPDAPQLGCTTFRIVAITAGGYLAYAPGKSPAPPAPGAPALGAPRANVLHVLLGVPLYVELPPNTQFLGDAVFATSHYEITAGNGGIGG